MSFHLKDEVVKSEKYKRDGAKYICKTCKKKFFAKMEVEQCFDSHAPAAKTEGGEASPEEKKKPA